jgi:ribonuclease Z
MKITFLGTSDAIPTAKRNHTSILLTYDGESILVDCGEGTQRQFRKAGLNPCKLTRILISHWHGDHILGLPGLLQSLALMGYNKTLNIYGPKGTKEFMKSLLNTFVFTGKYPINVEEVSGKFFETNDFYLEAKSMSHGIPTNAYSFVKKGQLRIDKKKLSKLKIPSGPLLGKIKQGKDIVYDGKKYSAKDLTYRDKEIKISFVLDTKINDKIIPFVKNSNLFICEGTFLSELEEYAGKHLHLTSKQAAEIAKKAKVEKLILTHVSQRYEKDMKPILNESKKVFKNSVLASDLEEFEIK